VSISNKYLLDNVVIKDRQSQKDRQHKGQQFEDTKRDNQRPSITEGQTTQGPKL
jgi:hypothetical protein